MSNLVLILRHRLDDVANWVMVDTAVLRSARQRVGLSYEAVARQIPVSSKTYERYEKQGRVPRELMARLMAILEIEVETPSVPPLKISSEPPNHWAEVLARLERIEQLIREVPCASRPDWPGRDSIERES